jgi:hypothetical protein
MSATDLALTFPFSQPPRPMNRDLSVLIRAHEESWFVGSLAEPAKRSWFVGCFLPEKRAKGHGLWGAFQG